MSKNFGQYSVKYRPKSFDDVLGNEEAVNRCRRVVDKRDVHAILLHGPSGCAKTTLGRLIANGLTNNASDIEEINISDKRGIDDVRGMISRSSYLPKGTNPNSAKVFLLDEVHELLGQAQSAILKEIEEPKHDRLVWVLSTDRPHKLQTPLFNRLYKVEVAPPPEADLARFLFRVIKREKIFTDFEETQRKRVAKEIAKASNRVPREALQLLQEVSGSEYKAIDFRRLVIDGIRKRVDGTVDRVALQVLQALYSTERKAGERASFLVNQLVEKDLWSLVSRLIAMNLDLLYHVSGVPNRSGAYYAGELKSVKAVPSLPEAIRVGEHLTELRNALSTTSTTLPQLVVPWLARMVFEASKHQGHRDGNSD